MTTAAAKQWDDLSIPQTEDEALELAEVFREWYIREMNGGSEDLTDECPYIAKELQRQFDGEIWSGFYNCDRNQYHIVCRVGDYLIDISGDQFEDGYEIACPHVDELADWYEYKTFRQGEQS